MRQVGDPETSDLTEREKVALLFLERFCLDWAAIDEAFQARMREVFTEDEIVELAWFCAFFSGGHRIHGIFDVEPPEMEVGNREELGGGLWLTYLSGPHSAADLQQAAVS